MKIQIEDTVYEGTAAGIMEQLRDLSFDPTEFPDVETYIWFVQNTPSMTRWRSSAMTRASCWACRGTAP